MQIPWDKLEYREVAFQSLVWGVSMSSLCPDLEICIRFLYSITISNDSAFYFFEICVLISLEGTPTQIRMWVGSITFHAKGSIKGQYIYFMPKSWTFCMYFVKILFSATQPLIFCGFSSAPDSVKNGGGLHHISWYGAQEGSICLFYVKIQNIVHVHICIFDR